MKKVAVVLIVVLSLLFLANTALAKYVDESDIVAKSGFIDVKIVERTKDAGDGMEYSSQEIDAVSSIKETLSNMAPGDSALLSYKIVNDGSIDVLLEGVNVATDNTELGQHLVLKWTLTQYVDSVPVNTVSNKGTGQMLNSASGNTDVSFGGIVLDSDNKTDDYCLLELEISFEDDINALNSQVQETVFTITPWFTQN
ncbi:MAG: hypothetical protein AB1Z23_02465 [Eubacteriales bacterium]